MCSKRFWCCWIGILFAAIGARGADIVNRKGGEKRAAGTITEVSKTQVVVKPSTGEPIAVPANDVASIDWDAAPSQMKLGRGDASNGKFEAALEKFQKAAEELKTGNEFVKTDLEFQIARATAELALTDPARRDDAVAKLNGFLKAHADSFRFYETQQWLGKVLLARQEFDAAKQAFDTLAQAPWSDYRLSAKVNLGRVLMSENKLDEAAQAFDDAIQDAGNTPADLSRKYEAMVGKANSLIAQQRYAPALESLNDVIDHAAADETALQAEAYVLQGRCLEAENKPTDAVLAFLHVDVLFPRESAFHAESLYHLAKLQAAKHPDRAAEAQAKLEGTYPHSEWAKKLGKSE